MKKKNDLTLAVNNPAEMILAAVSSGADLEKLKGLLELQERFEANVARKAYHKAMAAFKANPPTIGKNQKVGYSTSKGLVSYSHATLSNVVDKVSAELSKYGLSATWTTKQNNNISVTCRITHELGHSEETTLAAQADDSGSKNSIQAIGSTVTYLERYTLLSILGLATKDQDNDGRKSDKPEVVSSKPPVQQARPAVDAIIPNESNECHGCGAICSDEVKAFSKKRFGKCLCRPCQGKQK